MFYVVANWFPACALNATLQTKWPSLAAVNNPPRIKFGIGRFGTVPLF